MAVAYSVSAERAWVIAWIGGAATPGLGFKKQLAVYQILPGPEAHELCVYFGRLRGGKLGGFLAGLGIHAVRLHPHAGSLRSAAAAVNARGAHLKEQAA
jgi:hypothetical protein